MKAVNLLFAAAMTISGFAAPVAAQTPGAGVAQPLTMCAGAVAAYANLDVVSFPAGADGEWAPVLAIILAELNRVEGLEGMTGRYAASAARSHWIGRPRAEQERAAGDCRRQYGGQELG